MTPLPRLRLNALLLLFVHVSASVAFVIQSSTCPPQYCMMSANDNDDNEFFDPLLSPHAYPKGTNPSNGNEGGKDDDWSPMKMNTVKNDFRGATDDQYGVAKSTFTRKWSAPTINSINPTNDENDGKSAKEGYFDPLLSPHAYAKGTAAGPQTENNHSQQKQERNKIGILLVDHGSRREASNVHLETVASAYQQRAPDHYIIRAVHMEIAKPSIKDGIQSFMEDYDDVHTIICHPYFLSPGRHVIEDIPQLIQEAKAELNIMSDNDNDDSINSNRVQVLTTNHVGSKMEMMIDMIDFMVGETMAKNGYENNENDSDSGFVPKDPSSMGGFFGEVQRMLDEQL